MPVPRMRRTRTKHAVQVQTPMTSVHIYIYIIYTPRAVLNTSDIQYCTGLDRLKGLN